MTQVMCIFAKRTGKTMDNHASRIQIFSSTLALLWQGWYIAQDDTTVSLPSTEEVMATATMYSKPFRQEFKH